MKTPICAGIIVILGLLSVWFPNTLFATADGPDFYAVRNVRSDDVLNIRAEPNARAKIVGTIPFNAKKIENLGETFPEVRSDADIPVWCKVRYKDGSGWVACKHLREDSDL